jgi:hypothetical protein
MMPKQELSTASIASHPRWRIARRDPTSVHSLDQPRADFPSGVTSWRSASLFT